MSDVKPWWKSWWAERSPNQRTMIGLAFLAASFVGLNIWLVPSDSIQSEQSGKGGVKATNLMVPSRKDVTQETLAAGLVSTNNSLLAQNREIDKLKDVNLILLKRLEERPSAQDGLTADVVRSMAEMQRELDALKAGARDAGGVSRKSKLGSPFLDSPLPQPEMAGQGGTPEVAAKSPPATPLVAETPRLRVAGATAPEQPVSTVPAGSVSKSAFLPPAMFQGVLMTGMDVSTASVAQKHPMPAVVRIKGQSILPNLMDMGESDISECWAFVSGYGVLNTERANMRVETLVCVREDGTVIETELDGYVVAKDGKQGIPGRLVSKQGALIAKSMAAGFFSGFGTYLAPSQVPQLNVSPGGSTQFQSIDFGAAAQAGVARGFSDTAKSVAQLYLEIAKDSYPFVEILPGQVVTIVTTRGVSLAPLGNVRSGRRENTEDKK